MRHRLDVALFSAFFVAFTLATSALAQPADLVLRGGRVITVDKDWRVAQAVAIRDGRFLAVGDDAAIAAHIGPNTQVVELAGKTVVPGLIDSHLHQLFAGLNGPAVQLLGFEAVSSGLADMYHASEITWAHARQSSCDIPPGSCPGALSFGVGWDHGGGPCKTSRRSQSVRTRHLLLTPARSGSAARARASVLCVAPSAKSRAYARSHRLKERRRPLMSAAALRSLLLAAARRRLASIREPSSGATYERPGHRPSQRPRCNPARDPRTVQSMLASPAQSVRSSAATMPNLDRYEIGDHVGLAQGRHGTRARLAPLAKRSPQPPVCGPTSPAKAPSRPRRGFVWSASAHKTIPGPLDAQAGEVARD
jgi:hypothetical protein